MALHFDVTVQGLGQTERQANANQNY
jgi:hypothetical protein